MYTLMTDPVILPTSKTSIDRSTIRSHLLSDPNDPFNRSPLRIEDVVPDEELAERIRLFREERRGKSRAQVVSVGSGSEDLEGRTDGSKIQAPTSAQEAVMDETPG